MGHSIIRNDEYRSLSALTLSGKILDVGGSRKSGYHEIIKGEHTFTVINIDKDCEPDFFVNVEEAFPFEDNSFDHAVCLNVLEHVFEFQHVFSEQVRCVKKGGKIVVAAPFMHFIHGSPDDYLRYTASSYARLADKYKLKIDSLQPLGYGLFSLLFQFTGGSISFKPLRSVFQGICLFADKLLNKISKKYRNLTARIPLGYFVVFEK